MSVILLATDFTDVSNRARDFARDVARGLGAKLHLLHVIEPVDEPDSDDPETQAFYDKLEETARKRLEAEAEQLQPVAVTSSVLVAPRFQAILETAQELNATAVVLGTHPVEEGRMPYLGTSHKVAWKTDRPVILVP